MRKQHFRMILKMLVLIVEWREQYSYVCRQYCNMQHCIDRASKCVEAGQHCSSRPCDKTISTLCFVGCAPARCIWESPSEQYLRQRVDYPVLLIVVIAVVVAYCTFCRGFLKSLKLPARCRLRFIMTSFRTINSII